MNYKYILFDLDGTLTDPKLGITKSVAYALKSYGIEVEDLDSLLKFIGPPLKDSFVILWIFRRTGCRSSRTISRVFQAIRYL